MGAKKQILAIFVTSTPCLDTKLCPYELIFHPYIEENRIDAFCFIEKSFISDKIGKQLRVKIFALKIELYCNTPGLNKGTDQVRDSDMVF